MLQTAPGTEGSAASTPSIVTCLAVAPALESAKLNLVLFFLKQLFKGEFFPPNFVNFSFNLFTFYFVAKIC